MMYLRDIPAASYVFEIISAIFSEILSDFSIFCVYWGKSRGNVGSIGADGNGSRTLQTFSWEKVDFRNYRPCGNFEKTDVGYWAR